MLSILYFFPLSEVNLRSPNKRRDKYDFPFINICKVPREVLTTKEEAPGFLRDLVNVNERQNHV